MKAYLIYAEIEYPRIHDLTRLVAIAKTVDIEFEALEELTIILSDYATLYRYPTDMPVTCTKEDAIEAIEKAQRIREFVMGRIKSD